MFREQLYSIYFSISYFDQILKQPYWCTIALSRILSGSQSEPLRLYVAAISGKEISIIIRTFKMQVGWLSFKMIRTEAGR